MKRLVFLFFAFTLMSISSSAQNEIGNKSHSVGLDFDYLGDGSSTVHRAPICVNIDTYYNASSNVIEISYAGDVEGEVFLYLNECLIDHDCQINTSFQLPTTLGLYRIEIITDNWIAQGYLEL